MWAFKYFNENQEHFQNIIFHIILPFYFWESFGLAENKKTKSPFSVPPLFCSSIMVV